MRTAPPGPLDSLPGITACRRGAARRGRCSEFPRAWRTCAAGGGERQRAFSDRTECRAKTAAHPRCSHAGTAALPQKWAPDAIRPTDGVQSVTKHTLILLRVDGVARLFHLRQQISMCTRHGRKRRDRRQGITGRQGAERLLPRPSLQMTRAEIRCGRFCVTYWDAADESRG